MLSNLNTYLPVGLTYGYPMSIRPAIVVAIWNTQKRFMEYAPEIPLSSMPEQLKQETMQSYVDHYGKDAIGEITGDNYLKFMVEELKPYIDKNYSTLPSSADTFLLGSSMGGLISIYALAKYPEVYGGAMCLSTHWPLSLHQDLDEPADAIIGYLDSTLPPSGNHRIYFDFGTETLDAWYEDHQAKMDKVMEKHGFVQGQDWLTIKYEGEPHNESAWRKRLHIPVEMMLGVK
jgi:pimeloyl-ACP methyl ester carboxylesterase